MIFERNRISTEYLFKANEFYRKKQYNQSLSYYNKALDSIQYPLSKPSSQHGIGSLILSLRGLNYTSLRDYEKAEKDYDKVLKQNPLDTTTLHRRATLFLKTKFFDKAAKDIAKLYEIQPQSIRVSALVMEIKQKSEIVWKQQLKKLYEFEVEEQEEEDEQNELNFSNLKVLDRQIPKRVSIKQKAFKPRMSIVEFKEDQVITYEIDGESVKPSQPINNASMKDILMKQQKQLQTAIQKQNIDDNIIFFEGKGRRKQKSILKCSIMHKIPLESQKSIQETPMDVTRVINIDGKPIKHNSSQVKFITGDVKQDKIEEFDPSKLKQKMKRKSSIKPTMFTSPKLDSLLDVDSGSNKRTSFLRLKNTDGKILKKVQKQIKRANSQSESSDSGTQYNVFGDQAIENIQQQINNVFGLNPSSGGTGSKKSSNLGNIPKKSILKVIQPVQKDHKPKKSVLFR